MTGVALGEFEIQASDVDGMLLGLASGSNGSITTALVANVRLRPSGTVTGIVRDSAGEPGAFAESWRSPATALRVDYDRYPLTDASGSFTFTHVPAGAITVQSCVPAQAKPGSVAPRPAS